MKMIELNSVVHHKVFQEPNGDFQHPNQGMLGMNEQGGLFG
jgi:hypothetical protein